MFFLFYGKKIEWYKQQILYQNLMADNNISTKKKKNH